MKRLLSGAAALVMVLVLSGCAVHYDAENISRLYDSDWIIGKNISEIEDKYGGFDRVFTDDEGRELGAFYVNCDNGWLDPSYIHDTYFVVFEDGAAVDAYFAETSRGG